MAMKTTTQLSVISPAILVMGLIIVAVMVLAVRGNPLPLLSNLRVDLAIVLVLGMAICAQGGIGRVAALNQWRHPLSILGSLLGAAILIVSFALFFNLRLPLIPSRQQAFVWIAVLMGVKVLVSLIHTLLTNG